MSLTRKPKIPHRAFGNTMFLMHIIIKDFIHHNVMLGETILVHNGDWLMINDKNNDGIVLNVITNKKHNSFFTSFSYCLNKLFPDLSQ